MFEWGRPGRARTRAQGSHDGCHEEETVVHLVAPLCCGSQRFPLRAKMRAFRRHGSTRDPIYGQWRGGKSKNALSLPTVSSSIERVYISNWSIYVWLML